MIKKLFNKIIITINQLSFLKQNGLLILLGIMGALAFAPYFLFPILGVGFYVLMHCLLTAKTKKRAVMNAFSFGFGLGAASLSWLCNVALIDNGAMIALIPVILLGAGLLFGLFFAIPAFFASFSQKDVSKWLFFCTFFVVFEWVRSWLFTGFPWNLVGYIWTDYTPVIQIASVVGVYGLSFITILFFTSFALLPYKRYMIITGIIFIVMTLGGALRLYQAVLEDVWGVKIRLVQPNIQQSFKWDEDKAFENYTTLIKLSKKDNKDITHVIWPETAIPYFIEYDEVARNQLMGAVRQGGTLITGALRVADAKNHKLANSIFIIDDMANIKGHYDKSHLVPFGEYNPLKDIIPLDKIVPIPSDFVAGKGPTTLHIPKAPPASLLVCYEAIFPGFVAINKPRSEWMINTTNDAWYGISAGPYQHLAITQMRAVEEGQPLIRATNNGVSAVISPYGQILSSIPLGTQGVLDTTLPRAIPATLYAKHGNKIPLGILVFCIILALCTLKKRKDNL